MRQRFGKSVVVACFVGAALIGAALPAFGSILPSTIDVVNPPAGPVELKTNADGTSYWEAEIASDGPYLSSWGRSTGLWESPEEAMAAFTIFVKCQNNAVMNHVEQFDSYEAYIAGSEIKNYDDGKHTVEGAAMADALAICANDAQVDLEALTASNSGGDNESTLVQVPLQKMGPGEHKLFLASFSFLPSSDPACPIKRWGVGPDGLQMSVNVACNPSLGDVKKFTVTVPYEQVKTALGGPVVEQNTWFDSSDYSNLPVINIDQVIEEPEDTWKGVGLVVMLTLVLSVAIALPTALLDSTIDNNHGRISAALRRLIPVARRRTEPIVSAEGLTDSVTAAAPNGIAGSSTEEEQNS